MALSLFEVLQNADYNLQNNGTVGILLGMEQLHNAVTLLEKGYALDDDFNTCMAGNEHVDYVPDKTKNDDGKK